MNRTSPPKDARYVIRLAHNGKATPADQKQLLAQVRERVLPLRGASINLRVSAQAIEFDLFCSPTAELHPFLASLEAVGPVLSYRRLDIEPTTTPTTSDIIAEARKLFNEQRFWEFHEVLEGLWRKAKGEEKELLQGLILVAAAFVHVQKNENTVVSSMLEDAAERLEDKPAAYMGIDVERFLAAVKNIILTKNVHFPTI